MEQNIERKIYLEEQYDKRHENDEKKEGNTFKDKVDVLRKDEENKEVQGMIEASQTRDKYKAKTIERAINKTSDQVRDEYKEKLRKRAEEKGENPDEITEMPDDLDEGLTKELDDVSNRYSINGVHFLKCQFSRIIEDLMAGKRVEFEAFGPYFRDYIFLGFDSKAVESVKTDAIGLEIMESLRKEIMPEAHPASLRDEYNTWPFSSDKKGKGDVVPSDKFKEKFYNFIEELFKNRGIVKEGEKEGVEDDYVMISETEKIKNAEELVEKLKEKNLIRYGEGEEIWFQNTLEGCEDPRYMRINLRDKKGKWKCPCLDASGFLDERNRKITHLVILPKEHFEEQQDQVWEILRSIGFQPEEYHNIFFETENEKVTPKSAVEAIKSRIGVLLDFVSKLDNSQAT
jgi:hypothetical protein